ncbi:hypothetical protein D3C80_988770 [compost metagenome]
MVVLVGHYDELPGPLEPLAGDLAQQLTAEAPVAPILMGAYQLKAPHGAGEEEAAAGHQTLPLPDPPPLSQSIGDHGLIEVAPRLKVGKVARLPMARVPVIELQGQPVIPVGGGEGAGRGEILVARGLPIGGPQRQHHALHVLVSRRHEAGDPAVLSLGQRPLEGAMADPGILADQLVEAGFEPTLVTVAGRSGEQQIVAEVVIRGGRGAHGPEPFMVRHLALIAIEQQIGGKTGVIFHDKAPANA